MTPDYKLFILHSNTVFLDFMIGRQVYVKGLGWKSLFLYQVKIEDVGTRPRDWLRRCHSTDPSYVVAYARIAVQQQITQPGVAAEEVTQPAVAAKQVA